MDNAIYFSDQFEKIFKYFIEQKLIRHIEYAK